MDFAPLSWEEWATRYKRHIRVFAQTARLKHKPKVGLSVASGPIYIPWYDTGDWIDGKPKSVTVGTTTRLVRLPALSVGGRFLVLDGVHRLTELRPAFVLLDWIKPVKSDLVYFLDMHNPTWKRWAK